MLFANCSLGDDSICRGALVMLHKSPNQTKERRNPPSSYIVGYFSEFHLRLKQISFTAKPNGRNKLTAEQR